MLISNSYERCVNRLAQLYTTPVDYILGLTNIKQPSYYY